MKGIRDSEVVTVAEGKVAHKECYRCKICGCAVTEGKYRHHMNALYCTEDAKKQVGTPEWLEVKLAEGTGPSIAFNGSNIHDDGAFTLADFISRDTHTTEIDIRGKYVSLLTLSSIYFCVLCQTTQLVMKA